MGTKQPAGVALFFALLTLGSTPSLAATEVNLLMADASFLGEAAGDQAGMAVAEAGDVNADGYADFLIGAPYNDEGGVDAGQVYLVLGGPSGWARDTALASVDAFDATKRQTTLNAVGGNWQANQFAGLTVNPDTNQWRQFVIAENDVSSLTVWGNATFAAGVGDAFSIKDYTLVVGSDCINAGTGTDAPNRDLNNDPRPGGSAFDMGAFEYQPLPDNQLLLIIY